MILGDALNYDSTASLNIFRSGDKTPAGFYSDMNHEYSPLRSVMYQIRRMRIYL